MHLMRIDPTNYVVAVDKAGHESKATNRVTVKFGVVEIDEDSITTTQDPQACTMTVRWETNVPSTSVVTYGTGPNDMPYVVTGPGGTQHEVVCDLNVLDKLVFAYTIESATDCGSDKTKTLRIKFFRCIAPQ